MRSGRNFDLDETVSEWLAPFLREISSWVRRWRSVQSPASITDRTRTGEGSWRTVPGAHLLGCFCLEVNSTCTQGQMRV